jgi:RimJ/RimL family protein N-acetyltransferase
MDFRLREFTIDDLDSLVRYANNFRVSKNLSNKFPYPYTRENGLFFIDLTQKDTPKQIFAIEIQREVVGSIGVHPQADLYCRNAEIGYWLAEPYWGMGIVPKAIAQMLEYGFKTWDIDRIFAKIFGGNTGSQRVLEKTGFRLEAHFERVCIKNGEILDELIFGIKRSEYEAMLKA